MDFELTRRRLLGGGTLVGLGAIGYVALGLFTPANAPVPILPTDKLKQNGWTKSNQVKEELSRQRFGPIGIRVIGHSIQYHDEGLLREVQNRTVTLEAHGETFSQPMNAVSQNAFQQPLALLTASRIDMSPDFDNLPFGIGRAQLMDTIRTQSQEQFATTMQESGLQNVRKTEEQTIEIEEAGETKRYTFQADYPIEGGSFPVSGGSVRIPRSKLVIAGHLAVWHQGDHVFIGAGAHPAENYSREITDTLPSGADATITLDLGLRPAAKRREILDYIKQIQ